MKMVTAFEGRGHLPAVTGDDRSPRPAPLGRRAAAVLVAVIALAGCSSDSGSDATASVAAGSSGPSAASSSAKYPDVQKVEATAEDSGTYSFAVTISSPYDTPQRYADGWRVVGRDGTVYGEMTLGHDHASEQPFTRTQNGVEIPDGVDAVEVEGHDTENGYGGASVTVQIPGR